MFKRVLYNKISVGITLLVLLSSIFTAIYAHQLPIEKTQEKTIYEYTSKGVFNYTVTLYPNILYGDTTLVNPDKVFLKLVDKVFINVIYTFSSNPLPTNIKNTFNVEVLLSHPQIWSRKIHFTTIESQENTINHTIELDIPMVLSLARNISQAIDVPSYRYVITVNCIAKTLFTVANTTRTISLPFSLQINLDLAGRIVEFSQREFSSTGAQRNIEVSETTIHIGFVNISTRLFRQVSLASLFLVSIITAILVGINVVYLYRARKSGSLRLLNKYRPLIAEVSKINGNASSVIIRVKNLDELVKISENLVKPIIYLKASDKHVFYVLDGDITYVYEHGEENSSGTSN